MSVDQAHLARGRAAGHRFEGPNKASQIQVVGAATGNPTISAVGFGDSFSEWFVVAVPPKPAVDSNGNMSSATEVFYAEEGDAFTVLGTRDVRVSKFGQDVKEGDILEAYTTRKVDRQLA